MSGKRGFTLIELLVVVSIIAVLAAVLLPALSRARESAQKAVCASQERQIAFAIASYAQDHQGWHPLIKHTTGNMFMRTRDPGNIRTYLGFPSGASVSTSTPSVLKVLICPSRDPTLQETYAHYNGGTSAGTTYRIIAGRGDRGYGDDPYTSFTDASGTWYGWHPAAKPNGYSGPGGLTPLPRQQMLRGHSASAYPVLGDAFDRFGPGGDLHGAWFFGVSSGKPLNSHADGLNTAFFDGHVAWNSKESLAKYVQFYSSTVYSRLWW